jgi:hypothetical protein
MPFRDVRERRCELANCRGEVINPKYVVWLVGPATMIALASPIWSALGLTSSGISTPMKIPIVLAYLALWLFSSLLGCIRRHESELWCVVDSFGIPGMLSAFFGIASLVQH